LSAAIVAEVGATFGFAPRGPLTAAPGGRGTSVVTDTDLGRVLVKRYKATVDPEALRGEHAILRRLEEVDFPAPRVLTAAARETLLELDGARFAVFRHVDGHRRADARLLAPPDARHLCETAGATLAVLHETLRGFVPPTVSPNGFASVDGPRVRDMTWYGDTFATARAAADQAPADDPARHVADRLAADWAHLERLDRELTDAAPERLIVHGDYGPYNLLARPGWPLVVIDFELARLDWRLTDLATALPRFAGRRDGGSVERAAAFKAGYLARCPAVRSEFDRLPAVAAYLAVRRAIVCLANWAAAGDGKALPGPQNAGPGDRRPDDWLKEARDKMDVAEAWLDGRHPLAGVARGGGG
jgi:Ser/Thr protein kinase RdoA (MazF antagonist)